MDFFSFKLIQLVPFLLIYGVIAFILYRKKKTSIIQQIINLSFFVYILLAIGKVFLPIPLSHSYIQMLIEQGTQAKNNFIPFTDIYNTINVGVLSIILTQIIGNLLLLAPLGFYAPLIWTKFRSFKSILLLGFITSLGIESTQLIISTIIDFTYRSFVTDDIILNTIGVIIGFSILRLISPLVNGIIERIGIKDAQNKWLLNLRRL